MLDVLSIFAELSSNSSMDQQKLLGKFKLLPKSIQKAFMNKDSKALRSEYSLNQAFADGILAFDCV